MSLINDLLRDLEARDQLPSGALLPSAKPRSRVTGLFLLSGLVFTTAALGFAMQGVDSKSETAIPVDQTFASAAISLANSEHVDIEDLNDERRGAQASSELNNVAPPVVVQIENVADNSLRELQVKVAGLLNEAKFAFAANRLTTPLNDNAFNRYQAVLFLDADNEAAKAGIGFIVERYLRFAENSKSPAGRNLYLSKAQWVAESQPELAPKFLSRIAELKRSYPHTEAKPAELNIATLSAETNLRKEPSRAARQSAVIAAAKALVAQGKYVSAFAELDNFAAQLNAELGKGLKDGDAATEQITLAKLDLYIERLAIPSNSGNSDLLQAQALLKKLSSIAAHERGLREAKILLSQNRLADARRVLLENAPEINSAPDYFSLLAGLQHQLAEYRAAAALYRQLLDINSRQGTWWLGYAVSLDAMGDTGAALQAFRSARHFASGGSETGIYVEQRIAALTLQIRNEF